MIGEFAYHEQNNSLYVEQKNINNYIDAEDELIEYMNKLRHALNIYSEINGNLSNENRSIPIKLKNYLKRLKLFTVPKRLEQFAPFIVSEKKNDKNIIIISYNFFHDYRDIITKKYLDEIYAYERINKNIYVSHVNLYIKDKKIHYLHLDVVKDLVNKLMIEESLSKDEIIEYLQCIDLHPYIQKTIDANFKK